MNLIRRIALAAIAAVSTVGMASAQQYVDATTLRVINRGWDKCHLAFSRLPSTMQSSFNSTAWSCSMHSAGVAIRFATDSRTIGVKYTLWANTHMNHQAPTGTKGADLYILNANNEWRHVNTIRPADQRAQEGDFNVALDGSMHECMIYLPLYDGVTDMYVKLDEGATVNKGNYDAIDATKRVVMYGTSILQGGCASRVGMSPTAILSRQLNAEVINLGFSGGGKMEVTAAQEIAKIPNVSAFVIDPVPNCDDVMCRDLTYDFVKTIRDANPGVPVIMVEGPIYPYAHYNSYYGEYLPLKNKYFHDNYLRLLEENPTNLYYVTSENLDGVEDDGTIDGIHLSDLGFKYYAEKLYPVLEPFAKGTELMVINTHSDGATDVPLTTTFGWSRPEREGCLEISSTASFSSNNIVYTGTGKGSVTVPRYSLAASTTYYARVGYQSPGSDAGTMSYTPTVSFTTETADAVIPTMAAPVEGGTFYSNSTLSVNPIEGASSIRIEVSATTTFPGRSSYIITLPTGHFVDAKTGADIRLGGTALKDGETYYARARATYNTPSGVTTTDFSPVVTFTYNSGAGAVNAIEADEAGVSSVERYDLTGRRVNENADGAAITVTRRTDGSVTATKSL